MLESLTLQNVGPGPQLHLTCGQRINLITGDNGLGKSFLLDVAWWALTRKWPKEINPKLTSGYPAAPRNPNEVARIKFAANAKSKPITIESTYKKGAWSVGRGRPWNPGLVLYAQVDGSFSVWDPARNYWNQEDVGIEKLPAYVLSAAEVWNGLDVDLRTGPTRVCRGLVEDWASWIHENKLPARQMAAVLSRLSPSDKKEDILRPGPLTRISLNDARDIPTIQTHQQLPVPILFASAGIRRIAAFAYVLLWSWREHRRACELTGSEPTHQVTLLIDEIEAHLHPRWQRSILGSIVGLANQMYQAKVTEKKVSVQILAVTHSPLIMASAEPLFDPEQDRWLDLDLNSQAEVVLTQRPFIPQGDVANWLTSPAFDLGDARSAEAEQILHEVRLFYRQPKPSAHTANALEKKLQKVLPATDTFWIRWHAFKERLGHRDSRSPGE